MRIIFSILLFLLLQHISFAQVKIIKENELFRNTDNEIAIKIVNNNILVPVDLGFGLKLYFILDTGVNNTIITEPLLIELLNLPLDRKINIRGYGNDEPIPAWVTNSFTYQLNDKYKFENTSAIILDKSINLDQFLGEPVYGIIGYDFISKHQITIDFLRKKLYIKSPSNQKKIEKMRTKKKVKVFDIEFVGTKPFITTQVSHNDETDSLKLLVDTGFSGALSFFPNEKTDKYLSEPMIKNYQGYGMNGLILSQYKKIDELTINKNIKLKNVSTHFIDTVSLRNISHHKYSDGSIGNDIFRRFQVSFDYENGKLFLRPYKRRLKEAFYYNRAGIRVLFDIENSNNLYIVQSIRKGSNAAQSGLQPKDKIVSINAKDVKKLTITKVYKLLNDFSLDERTIIIERNNELITFNFTINTITKWN